MKTSLTSFHVETHPGETHVIPVGELDIDSAGELDREVRAARVAGAARVVVDLRRTTFVDSTGLRALVVLRNEARRSGAGLQLIPGPATVQRVFTLTRTASLFDWRGAAA